MSFYYTELINIILINSLYKNKVKDNIEDNIVILEYEIYYTVFRNLSVFSAKIFTCMYF